MVDFNGDGRDDVISGSYSPGNLYLFAKQADGTFAAGEVIKDKDGIPVRVGAAAAVYAADWDNDRDLDLVVGNISGEVYLITNEGGVGNNAFAKAERLKAAGSQITVAHGDAGPVLADWDGDGLLDLLVGAGDGSVNLYRNRGTTTEPDLETGLQLVPPADSKADGNSCGTRTKICVADFNEDGAVDLLVGDFGYRREPPPDLTDEQKKLAEERQKEYQAAIKEYTAAYQKTDLPALMNRRQELSQAPPGESTEAARARAAEIEKIMEKYTKVYQGELKPLIDKLQAAQQKIPGNNVTYHGFVWLYLRQTTSLAAEQ